MSTGGSRRVGCRQKFCSRQPLRPLVLPPNDPVRCDTGRLAVGDCQAFRYAHLRMDSGCLHVGVVSGCQEHAGQLARSVRYIPELTVSQLHS